MNLGHQVQYDSFSLDENQFPKQERKNDFNPDVNRSFMSNGDDPFMMDLDIIRND